MAMKQFITATALLLVTLTANATGQEGDIIYIDGTEWELLCKPIHSDKSLSDSLYSVLPKGRSVNTANSSGYTARWTMKGDSLYLMKIEYDVYDKQSKTRHTESLGEADMRRLFPSYSAVRGVWAQWVSGEIRAGQGSVIRYTHSGFDRNMQTERTVSLRKGRVTRDKTWHNAKTDGLKMENIGKEVSRRFPWQSFPMLKGRRIAFSLDNIKVKSDGRLSRIDVTVRRISPHAGDTETLGKKLAKAIKATLKDIHPWETLYVNGRYRTEHRTYVAVISDRWQ